jgi:hypothetical protein
MKSRMVSCPRWCPQNRARHEIDGSSAFGQYLRGQCNIRTHQQIARLTLSGDFGIGHIKALGHHDGAQQGWQAVPSCDWPRIPRSGGTLCRTADDVAHDGRTGIRINPWSSTSLQLKIVRQAYNSHADLPTLFVKVCGIIAKLMA